MHDINALVRVADDILIHLRVRCTVLFGGFLCALHDNIAERNHFHLVGQAGKRRHMFPIGDAAAPDDADFQFAHLFFLLQINFHVNPFTGKGA